MDNSGLVNRECGILFTSKRGTKRTILLIIAIVVSLSVIWLGVQVFLYFKPSILIKKSIGKAEDFYSEVPMVFIEKESVFGTTPVKKAQVLEFTDKMKKSESRLGKEYQKPMTLQYTIEEKYDGMLIMFSGTAVDSQGNPIEVEEQIEFDFVLDFER